MSDTEGKQAGKIPAAVRIGLLAVVGVGSMVLLMAWLAGAFVAKIQPRERGKLPSISSDLAVVTVAITRVPVVREVTGSIAAEHETNVASQLLGRVASVGASAGQRVKKGQVLVTLDEAEHRSRLEQAEALHRQARDRYERIDKQHRAQAATEAQLVEARTSRQAAQARVEEAQTFLARTKILAPVNGVLVERLCEVGDTLTPGRIVGRIYDRLQLVATVPESLQPHLSVGDKVMVRIDALGKGECGGEIKEIVPQAQALSRAFQVKVSGPCPPGLIPGMFGRLKIPLGERDEIRVPLAALRRVGQVPMVFRVLPDGVLLRQFVQTGEVSGEGIAISSGLKAGDRIVADAARVTARGEAR